VIRRRRSTANRTMVPLRAALNLAFLNGKVVSDLPWKTGLKPFRETHAARERHLSIDECKRLVNAAQGSFRDLVQAGLFAAARYSEICRLHVRDYSADSGTLYIARSKSGRERHIHLNSEGQAFFRRLTAGRAPDDVMLVKNGKPWGTSHQIVPMKEACLAARIEPAVGFHCLRHTAASLWIMSGIPLVVAAAQLGHSGTAMVERHYGHLSKSHITESMKLAPTFGVVEPSNVVTIGG
jgi:integrase